MSAFVINPYRFGSAPFNMYDYNPDVWLDAADSSTMFIDLSGATPASVGDDVKLWVNKGATGTANDFFDHASSSANPPSLEADGLQFAVNEALYGGNAVNSTGTNIPYGVIVACQPDDTYTTDTNDRIVFGAGALAGGRCLVFCAPYQGSTASRFISIYNFIGGQRVDLVSLTRRKLCIYGTCNDMGYNEGRVNGIEYATTGVSNSWISGRGAFIGDGRVFGGTYRSFIGKIYELVAWKSAVTQATVEAVETHLMSKWSIT